MLSSSSTSSTSSALMKQLFSSSCSISTRTICRQQQRNRSISTSSASLNQSHQNESTNDQPSISDAIQPTSSQSSSTKSKSNNNNNNNNQSSKSSSLSTTSPLQFDHTDLSSFPSLIHRTSPLYDSGKVFHTPTSTSLPYPSSFTLINESDARLFKPSPPSAESLIASSGGSTSGGTSGSDKEGAEYLSSVTSLSTKEINDLHKHAIQVKRVVKMSGKGKIARYSSLVVVGNGNGLVGYGSAKDSNAGRAGRKAFQQGVKSMDYVRRFENRTVETEIEGKWSATRVILRPRPAGFGLRVPPSIHAVARSAGLSDLSASIRGSTNPSSVVKATLQALWPGAAPIGLGDGLGGEAKRSDKGCGARSREEIMRERGRRLEDVRLV